MAKQASMPGSVLTAELDVAWNPSLRVQRQCLQQHYSFSSTTHSDAELPQAWYSDISLPLNKDCRDERFEGA